MKTTPTSPMDLTTFRDELTLVVDSLDETGPIRLTKYNAPVAEIRSLTPAADHAYTRSIVDTFGYLEDLGGGLTVSLLNLGVDSLAELHEVVRRHKGFTDDGVTFDRYPEHSLPESGDLSVDEVLAYLYFGDEYPEGAERPYVWFQACARLQSEAAERDMKTTLPHPNAYDEKEPTFVQAVIAAGHTPDSLTELAIKALDQNVQLENLLELIGSDPIPADVLAMDSYSDYGFETLKESGLPHGETVTVFRKGLDIQSAKLFASAGIRTADEIEELIAAKLSAPLALRAAEDGVTVDEWRVQVPKVQRLKYEGITGGFGSQENGGLLPFRLLFQAAEEGVSLVRWDKNSMPVAEEKQRYFYADSEKRQTMYPWSYVYPDGVLELGRAGLSPSYITAFGTLMRQHFTSGQAEEDFVGTAIRAHGLGLSTSMMNSMTRTGGRRPNFTPAELFTALELGLDEVKAYQLADMYATPELWFRYLMERRSLQTVTDEFVAAMEGTAAWETVKAAAEVTPALMKGHSYLRNQLDAIVIRKFRSHQVLDDLDVATLLRLAVQTLDRGTFGRGSYLDRSWVDAHAGSRDVLADAMDSFAEKRREKLAK